MTDVNSLIQILERDQGIIRQQAEGLSHADMVLQLPFRGNCFNWVIGHILTSRASILTALEAEPILSEEEIKRYGHGSEPVTDADNAVPYDRLSEALAQTKDAVIAALKDASPELLGKLYNEEWGMNVGQWVAFLIWHETYHVGQLEILRQLAGMDDAII
jgi:uncharacterized damage-inducible protein DinB